MRREQYLLEAARAAEHAMCERSQCGSVIVKNDVIIGRGWNSPPREEESERRCSKRKDEYDMKVTDKTCCLHAEQRAIMDALRRGHDLAGASLYFIRLKYGTKTRSGAPYCTICSKMALDTGIKEFVLWHEDGIKAYDTSEYNTLSFGYRAE